MYNRETPIEKVPMSAQQAVAMNAVRYHRYGSSDVLVHEVVDRPTPGPGQVLVAVAGTSFNDADAGLRAGLRQDVVPVSFPHIPQMDLSGVVAELGEGTTGWSVGDRVIGLLPTTEHGAAADYVAAPAGALTPAPRDVPLADAAALPLAGLTAWQALFDHAAIETGQSILIYGASGAVGGYAVQLAVDAGMKVTATAGPRSHERVSAYGADHVVDYTSAPIEQLVDGQRFDVVLNLAPIGPEEATPLLGLVTDGGSLVTMVIPFREHAERDVRIVNAFARGDASQLGELVARVDDGRLSIWVAERLPLRELTTVHARAAGRLVELGALVARVEGGDVRMRWYQVADQLRAEASMGHPWLTGKTVLIP